MYLSIIAAALVATSGISTKAVAQTPSIALVFHIAPPASDVAALAQADVALRAPEELGVPLRAMRGHPRVKLTFALTSSYLRALEAASAEATLEPLSSGASREFQQPDVLAILARHRPIDSQLARTPAGSRYLTLATAARNFLAGGASVPFTAQDLADFAAVDAQVALLESGFAAPAFGAAGDAPAQAALARADREIAAELKEDVRRGSVEIVALPDGEPVLPLLIDAGGRSSADPHVVQVGARADAAWLIADAVRKCAAAAVGQRGCGFYSPYGAYDDATGALIQNARAGYALFSDRVVRGAGGQGTQGGLDAARAAALHAYALTTAKGVTVPTLFWSEAASNDLNSVTGSETAAGERLVALAHEAADRARDSYPHVLVLRLDAQGPWVQRPDARAAVERLIAAIGSGQAGRPTTLLAFVQSNAPTASAYGYPPNAESGSLALWMGSANQRSLWTALADARKAAGGDAALTRPEVRALLFAAEEGYWYALAAMPLTSERPGSKLDAFRGLIARLYHAAGARPPAVIAPVEVVSPAPSLAPLASPPAAPPRAP